MRFMVNSKVKTFKYLTKLLDILHQAYRNIIGRCFKTALGIYPDDRFSVRSTQMNPITVELYLEAVFCVYRMLFIFLLYLIKYFFYVYIFPELNFIFGDEIIRIFSPE